LLPPERERTTYSAPLELKAVAFDLRELKAADDGAGGWTFTGYASTYGGEPDSYGDIVAAGAFDASLKRRPKPKLLWQHDLREPIGVPVDWKSDDRGLLGTWRIVDTARGQDAYRLLKAGAVDSLSIGFLPTEVEYDKDGEVRTLKQIDLLEVSVVSVPANERALVTQVKADPEQSLAVYWAEVTDTLITAVARAEALERRRAADGRELSDAQAQVLTQALTQMAPCFSRLSDLLATRQEAKAEAASIALRLELARRKARRAGLLAEATPSSISATKDRPA
jgi:HK97 family phage prohead protease